MLGEFWSENLKVREHLEDLNVYKQAKLFLCLDLNCARKMKSLLY
jgi:hypothetical protein